MEEIKILELFGGIGAIRKAFERQNIPHHLIDVLEPNEEYSVYDYQKEVRKKIEELTKQNKRIIIVGGTGLYIKAALYDYTFVDGTTTKQYETIDAYSIKVEGFDFTNKLVDTEEKPIIPVKPSHINTLTIKLDFNDNIDWKKKKKTSNDVNIFVTLKQMETLINNGTVSYTSNSISLLFKFNFTFFFISFVSYFLS